MCFFNIGKNRDRSVAVAVDSQFVFENSNYFCNFTIAGENTWCKGFVN